MRFHLKDGNDYFNCQPPQIALRDIIQASSCEINLEDEKPKLSFSLFTDIGKYIF